MRVAVEQVLQPVLCAVAEALYVCSVVATNLLTRVLFCVHCSIIMGICQLRRYVAPRLLLRQT